MESIYNDDIYSTRVQHKVTRWDLGTKIDLDQVRYITGQLLIISIKIRKASLARAS